jgi:hypothetical protein
MVRDPVRVPAIVGVKVTEMAHAAPAARLGMQVPVAEKSPLTAMPETLSATVPWFTSVTVLAALAVPTCCASKVKLAGEVEAAGPPVPVPCKVTYCGLPGALSLTVSTPLDSPSAVGANATLSAQLAPGAIVEGQPFVSVKEPLAVTLAIFSGAPLGLLTVTAAGG